MHPKKGWTNTNNGYEVDEQIVYKSKAGGSIHCSSRHILEEDNERWVAPKSDSVCECVFKKKKKKSLEAD